MKTRNAEVGNRKSEALKQYRATHNAGSVIYLRRIGMSRDDAQASRRFFNQHKHVLADEAGSTIEITPLLIAFCSLLIVVAILAAKLVAAHEDYTALEEYTDKIEAQNDRFMQHEQKKRLARETDSAITNHQSEIENGQRGSK